MEGALLDIIIIILHSVICDHYGRLGLLAFESSYELSTSRQHLMHIMWRHMVAQSNPQPELGPQSRISFTGMGSFTLPGDNSRSTQDLRLYWNPNQSCVQTGD